MPTESKEEKLTTVICCNQPVSILRDAEYEGAKGVGIWCTVCGVKSFHEDEKTAISLIESDIKKKQEATDGQQELDVSPPDKKKKESKKVNKPSTQQNTQKQTALVIVPKNAGELQKYFDTNQNHLIEITSPVIGDQSAMLRLINNNMRYVQNAKQLKDVWTSQEGQESIIHETEEAMIMGAELGKMGDLVPFGAVCQFIPSVEAYEFALTNGKNAPFKTITITPIYEGDTPMIGWKDEDFFLDNKPGFPRGKVISVAVYGLFNKSGHIIGEVYDAERLLEKAAVHSKPYNNYLKMINAFEYAKSEGKSKINANGREFFTFFTIKDVSTDKYFQKSVDNFYAQESAGKLKKDSKGEYSVEVLPKKGDGTWEKKTYRSEIAGGMEEKIIYIDELVNPYAGPDQPEMLRKTAGKSFLGKYAKVRNSEAAMDEVRTHKKAVNQALDLADKQLRG